MAACHQPYADRHPTQVAQAPDPGTGLDEEGVARELVNRVQNLRKDKDFEVTDKIALKVQRNKSINSAISNNLDYICAEILADSLDFVPQLQDGTEIEVNDNLLRVSVNKKG